jgi:hypothetical protein
MMPKRSFDRISFELANLKFNAWCKELTGIIEEAHNGAVNSDGRLCDKTKQGISDRFMTNMKRIGIQRELQREREMRYGIKSNR